MKVTIVVSTLRAGGMERVAVNMANHWAARGWQPTLLTTSQRGRPVAFDLHPGVTYRDLGWHPPLGDAEIDPASLRAVARTIELSAETHDFVLANVVVLALLRRAIIDSAPRAVIALGDITNIRTMVATEGLGIRRFVSERCDPRDGGIGAWEPLRQKFYRRADRVVTLTRDAASYFERFGYVCQAIPNIVVAPPSETVAGQRATPAPAPPPPYRLVTVSRLVASKRLNILIRAFAHIAPRHPDWRLDIWGEGPERKRLQRLIDELGAGDRIRLQGQTRDVYAALRESHLFAMTSSSEGFPNALCEAMACGLAAVVIDCGPGVRDIVRHGVDGVLVQGEGAANFASVLDRLMHDDEERGRLAARAAEIIERFGAESVMRQWEELIA